MAAMGSQAFEPDGDKAMAETQAQTQAPGSTASGAAQTLAESEAFAVGYHAYLWGYVYVKSMLLRDEATHPDYKAYAPVNALHVHTELAKPGFTDFTPNIDTLYGLGWLDLSNGPVLMQVPAMGERYWTVQATDAALNCAEYVGRRMRSKPGLYAYCHSGWSGKLPPGVHRIDVPTHTVFIQLRTVVDPGVAGDIEAVAALNARIRFEPLNPGPVLAAPVHTPPRDPKNTAPHFHSLDFFALLNEAVTRDNVVPGEEAVAAQFAALGIGPGQRFDLARLNAAQQRGLQAGLEAAFARMAGYLAQGAEQIGGWSFLFNLGRYGHDFLARAVTACYGYGANEPVEATYPFTVLDAERRPLDGANRYRIRIAADRLPPVDAFWSITMYSRPENQLVDNPIDRYNIGSATPGLVWGADGSLEIAVQHAAPAAGTNWLPAPAGPFWMILRMYQPRPQVLTRQYAPPAVERLIDSFTTTRRP